MEGGKGGRRGIEGREESGVRRRRRTGVNMRKYEWVEGGREGEEKGKKG